MKRSVMSRRSLVSEDGEGAWGAAPANGRRRDTAAARRAGRRPTWLVVVIVSLAVAVASLLVGSGIAGSHVDEVGADDAAGASTEPSIRDPQLAWYHPWWFLRKCIVLCSFDEWKYEGPIA